MFSLIITIISIALVAALALATLFYGGSIFSQGSAQGAAARYIVQGQQVLGAAELFRADLGRWPDSMEEMVSLHYLRSAPSNVAQTRTGTLRQAQAEDLDAGLVVADRWKVVKAGRPVYRLIGVQPDACLAVNQKNFGVAGVLGQLRASWASQCYSPEVGGYAVVVTKDEASLVDAMPEAVTFEALPEPGSARWVLRPGAPPAPTGPMPGGTASPTQASAPMTFGDKATTAPVAYTNTTERPLRFSREPSISDSGTNPDAFTVITDCPAVLAAGQGCTAQVTFTPGIEPTYAAALVFDTSEAVTVVPLVGVGLPKVAPPAIESALPEFVPVKPGTTSTRTFTVTNLANKKLLCPLPPAITGENASAFSATTACPASLAPGDSCDVTVTFTPGNAPGTQEALLTLPCHTTEPVAVPLVAEVLTLQDAVPSVAQYHFGGVHLGQYRDYTVGLDNTGTAALHLTSVPRIEEDVTGGFSLVANTCGATLATGMGCDVTVRFAPTVLGEVAAVLAIDTDASGSPQRITLGGLGLPALVPLAQLSGLDLNFGRVATNTTVKRSVVLSNPGTDKLTLTALPELTASTSAAITPGLTTCAGSLAINASCSTEVIYSPVIVGEASGTLAFATNAAGSPSNVALSGTAYNPVSLASATLPTAKLGQPYAPFHFSNLLAVSNESSPTLSAVAWSKSGTLPAGLTFSTSGVLSGTPTALASGMDITVQATYKLNQSLQAYTIRVGVAVLEVLSVSAGTQHTCAVTKTGGVKCWGRDNFGQLGNDAALIDQPTPVDVSGLDSGVVSVSVGTYHTCALTTAGAVLCWGRDTEGQLGNDAPFSDQSTPVAVQGLTSGVASLTAGGYHNCVVTSTGGAQCWGKGTTGQLGISSTANKATPVSVLNLSSGVASISAGSSHTCAVTVAGAAKCWGYDYFGQLGDNASLYNQFIPVDVSGLTNGVASISAGAGHTCAVLLTGAAKCWGWNDSGQLGTGTLTSMPTPAGVSGMSSGVVRISAGGSHTCAVTTDGAVKCWGLDNSGQLGNDTGLFDKLTPVAVLGMSSGVTSVSAGSHHTCALTTAGAAKCWGFNFYGQLGAGLGGGNQPTPVNVAP